VSHGTGICAELRVQTSVQAHLRRVEAVGAREGWGCVSEGRSGGGLSGTRRGLTPSRMPTDPVKRKASKQRYDQSDKGRGGGLLAQ
jgi:hypothetical protein